MIKLFPCKPNSKTILIYCSVVPHDFPPHHRLNFAKQLSTHYQVIFIDLPGGYRIPPLSSAAKFYIYLLGTLFKFDNSFVWEFFRFRKLHLVILLFYLLFQKLILGKKIILYTTNGYYDQVYSYVPFDASVFDCPDIHKAEFEKNKIWINKFDLIFVNTKLVLDLIKKYNNRIQIIPSGYRNASKVNFSSQKIPNSVLFLGGISQRIDYELLSEVIKKLSDITFYFIGEVYLNKYYAEPEDRIRLKKWDAILDLKNVRYLGEFSEPELRSILPFFEVGIIPYHTSDVFNYYSNPIKLYDYLASGIYVISTHLANTASFSKDFPVFIARSPHEFIRKIKLVLGKPHGDIVKYKSKVTGLLLKESIERKTSRVLGEISL